MYERIINAARDAVWCITEPKLDEIFHFLDAVGSGVSIDAETVKMIVSERREKTAAQVQRSVGVIPVIGTISQRVGLMDEASGGASTQSIGQDFDAMINADDVGSIMFEIDSPGGTYPGIPELAEKIFNARGTKPMVAMVNAQAGSGAYWLASAVGEVVVTPSGDVGSIGAYTWHDDLSVAMEDAGVQRRYISYGEFKVEGNPDEPLTDEAALHMQAEINRVGKEFEGAIAKFRGVSPATVRADFGRGRMINAAAAVKLGMADKVGTIEETIARLAGGKVKAKGRRTANARRIMEMSE